MIPLPSRSPFTGGEIIVTRFYCPDSDTSVEGQFAVSNPFAQLSQEQLEFVELFVRSEGRISRMEGELALSYPTIRNRLKEIVEALGYDPEHGDDMDNSDIGSDEMQYASDMGSGSGGSGSDSSLSTHHAEERQRIIKELDEGRISFDEAMSQIGEIR